MARDGLPDIALLTLDDRIRECGSSLTGAPTVLDLPADRPPGATIEDQARWYLDAIREVRPASPYHLGGWSMGGLVAYEIARRT